MVGLERVELEVLASERTWLGDPCVCRDDDPAVRPSPATVEELPAPAVVCAPFPPAAASPSEIDSPEVEDGDDGVGTLDEGAEDGSD